MLQQSHVVAIYILFIFRIFRRSTLSQAHNVMPDNMWYRSDHRFVSLKGYTASDVVEYFTLGIGWS